MFGKHAVFSFCLAFPVLLLCFAAPSQGARIVATSTADQLANDTRCTLREAIESANQDQALFGCTAGSGPDLIELNFTNPVVLTRAGGNEDDNQTGDFDITEDLTIRPLFLNNVVTIDAAGLDRVFDLFGGADLTLQNLRITGGVVIPFGGGVFVRQASSTLRLIDAQVVDNEASLFGGGVYGTGPVFLEGTSVESNRAAVGGGIYMDSDDVLDLQASRLRGNRATSDGGGASVRRLIFRDSTVVGNRADRDGGGVAWRLDGGASDVSFLINSTVAENSSFRDGGGLFFDSPGIIELYNTTVAWNVADEDADGVGSGGGVFVDDGQVRPRNSVVASNLVPTAGGANVAPSDCFGALSSLGHNLFGVVDPGDCQIGGTANGNLTGTVADPIDAELDCLMTTGGPGVVKPFAGSPVIDAGEAAGCMDVGGGTLAADQLGNVRPWDGFDPDLVARCDIGAVEFGAPSPDFIFVDGFESGGTTLWSFMQAALPGDPSTEGTPRLRKRSARGGGGGACVGPEILARWRADRSE
ncbi:MAG: CSLREA domain-containing protein [Acidobacteriota bacterium]